MAFEGYANLRLSPYEAQPCLKIHIQPYACVTLLVKTTQRTIIYLKYEINIYLKCIKPINGMMENYPMYLNYRKL